MNHYNFTERLKEIWHSAVEKYRGGNREPETYFDKTTLAELASMGLNTMDVYDYAEDFVSREEPSLETFITICAARRDYFLNVQKGEPSSEQLDPSTLPAKEAEARGITWLPRIMPKAVAKLRGELPGELMYCCGGDRRFFKTNNIHPAEFLRAAWAYEDDFEKLTEWVEKRVVAGANGETF